MKNSSTIHQTNINISNLSPGTVAICQQEMGFVLEVPSCVYFVPFSLSQHNALLLQRGNVMLTLHGCIVTLDVFFPQVHGASCHCLPRRNPSFWLHFH